MTSALPFPLRNVFVLGQNSLCTVAVQCSQARFEHFPNKTKLISVSHKVEELHYIIIVGLQALGKSKTWC